MDQIQIGRFIAKIRKEEHLTQKQLADALSISDKTISKWECGKGLPEVSLMLPLCEALHITVNDLLTGERISEADYRNKAEENLMNLMQENAENKKQLLLSLICGGVTIVAVCSLVALAASLPLPAAARTALVLLAAVTAVMGVGAACALDVKAGYFECPHCRAQFVPSVKDYVKGVHTLTRRRLTCPECGRTALCRHRLVR